MYSTSHNTFRTMNNITAGIFATAIDYNATSVCLNNGLDRLLKQYCRVVRGMNPKIAGALLLWQVRKTFLIGKDFH
jgi:hypothetical protein